MKQIKTILALLLCLCMLPMNMLAAAADNGALKATTYTPAESGLYAVTVKKDGETVNPLPAKAAVYEPALTVSVTAGDEAAQEVDYNVFWLVKGTEYSVQLQKLDEAFDASGDWTLSVDKVDVKPLTLNADALTTGEWFSFTPGEDGDYAITAAPAPVFVEVLTEGTVSGDWDTYALDKEKCRVGMELDYLRSLKAAIAGRQEALDQAEQTYNKALDKLENYKELKKLADDTNMTGTWTNVIFKKQTVYDALKAALLQDGVSTLISTVFPNLSLPSIDKDIVEEMPADVTDLPNYLSEKLASSEGIVGEAKAKYEEQKAAQEADQARYDAGIAANPQLADLIDNTSAETATLRQQVQTDADAIKSSASALAVSSGMTLVAAAWQNGEDGSTFALTKDKAYIIHALSNLVTSATVTDGTGEPVNPDDPGGPDAPDKSPLQDLFDDMSKIDLSKYTDESAGAFTAAIEKAKEVLDDPNAKLSDIEDAVKKLREAYQALEEKETDTPPEQTVNKTELAKAIKAAEDVQRDKYTADSLRKMDQALNAAKNVNDDADATQKQVDDAAKALNDAVKALKEKEETHDEVDRSALKKALDDAAAIDRDKYTADSLKTFDNVVKYAKGIYDDDSADQAQVSNAAGLVKLAIDDLKEKSNAPQPAQKCDGGASCPSKVFKDVDQTKWYHEAVDYAIVNSLFNGTSKTTFEPNTAMTRGMLVTVLYRMEHEPEVTGTTTFTDLKQDWYKNAVAWAAENKIVNGISATRFAPMDKVTREQAMTMLMRYAEYKGYDVSARDNLSAFSDASSVSSWAKDAMQWAVKVGLIKGMTETTVVPRGDSTRAQVATILMRFQENIAK